MQLQLDNPLHLDFTSTVHVNGKVLGNTRSCGTTYNPCLGAEYAANHEAMQIMEHYGLDTHFGWVILRSSYPWATKRRPEIRNLSVTMRQDAVFIPGPHFHVRCPGDTIAFPHGGQEHVLTVQEYGAQTMDWSRMPDSELVYPSHYIAMSYTITPDLPDGVLSLADCDDGDGPRQIPSEPGQPIATACTMVMGITDSSDHSHPIVFGESKRGNLYAACSALHFHPVDQVEWRMVFCEKQFADTTVDLLDQ